MNVAAAGYYILFLCSIVGQIIVCLYVLSYAAHCFLSVIQDTAAGSDDIAWPDEPFIDSMWKFWYLVWLVAFWLIPVWLLVRAFGTAAPVSRGALGVILAVLLWVVFPLSLLSSMGASSKLIVLQPKLLKRLIKRPHVLAIFYVSSGVVWFVFLFLAYTSLARMFWPLVPVAGLVWAAAVLIYGRLTGRLAWMVREMPPNKSKKKKKIKPPVRVEKVVDPWSIPKEEEPAPAKEEAQSAEEEGEGIYRVTDKPKLAAGPAGFELPEGYDVADKELPPRPEISLLYEKDGQEKAAPYGHEKLTPKGLVIDEDRFLKEHAPKPPRLPLLEGIYNFPWYRSTLKRWLWLSLGGSLIALGLYFQLMLIEMLKQIQDSQ